MCRHSGGTDHSQSPRRCAPGAEETARKLSRKSEIAAAF
jgi:hypothetical protein